MPKQIELALKSMPLSERQDAIQYLERGFESAINNWIDLLAKEHSKRT